MPISTISQAGLNAPLTLTSPIINGASVTASTLNLPTWTTGTRPSSPVTGQTGFNTTLGSAETYNGSSWVAGGGLNTQAVQTTGFTAVAGNIYPCNTTSAAFTVTLPASPSLGNQIGIVDYAGTFGTNRVTVNPNGGKINWSTANDFVQTNRTSIILA